MKSLKECVAFLSITLFIGGGVCIPLGNSVFAAESNPGTVTGSGQNSNTQTITPSPRTSNPETIDQKSGQLTNPLGDVGTIDGLLYKVIDVLLVFLTPLIVLFIMYAGFLYVTAAGAPDKITKAHNALLWALVGGVIVVGARVLLTVIQGTVSDIL